MGLKQVATKKRKSKEDMPTTEDTDSERTVSAKESTDEAETPLGHIFDKLKRKRVDSKGERVPEEVAPKLKKVSQGDEGRKKLKGLSVEKKKEVSPKSKKKELKKNDKKSVQKQGPAPSLKEEVTKTKKKSVEKKKVYVHCRPGGLVDLVNSLSNAQKDAVNEIGFGGLLSVKVTKFAGGMVNYLMSNFNGVSSCLRIGGKQIVVTDLDVQDIFDLPRNSKKDVVEYDKSEKWELLNDWKEKYGFDFDVKKGVYVSRLTEIMLERLKDGGDDFKRLFVLFCLSSFLAPTSNRLVDIRPLASVLDVEQIKSFNWCKYVLGKLQRAAVQFKPTNTNINGCVMVLQVVYFQRCKWAGSKVGKSVPLIQNWTTESMNQRVRNELLAGPPFGQGQWDLESYPIHTESDDDDSVEEAPLPAGVTEQPRKDVREKEAQTLSEDIPEASCRGVFLKLDDDLPDDAAINASAKDEMDATFMILRRNFEVITRSHKRRLEEIMKREKRSEDDPEASNSTPVSDTQKFYSNPDLYKLIDQIVADFLAMKEDGTKKQTSEVEKAPARPERPNNKKNREITAPSFRLLTPSTTSTDVDLSQQSVSGVATELNEVADDLNVERDVPVTVQVSEAAQVSEPEAQKAVQDGGGTDEVVVEEAAERAVPLTVQPSKQPGQELKGSLSKKTSDSMDTAELFSDDAETSNLENLDKLVNSIVQDSSGAATSGAGVSITDDVQYPSYASQFMRSNKKLVYRMPSLTQTVLDYVFYVEDMNPEEILFQIGDINIIPRKDFMSLDKGQEIFITLIDAWCLVLNDRSKQLCTPKRKEPLCFFLGSAHSSVLNELYEAVYAEQTDVELVDNLEKGIKNYWKDWIKQNDAQWETYAAISDMVFIPIHDGNHYYCVVINHYDERIDYLDNVKYTADQIESFIPFLKLLVNIATDFLRERNFVEHQKIKNYKFCFQKFNWHSRRVGNKDCGVFLMKHMQHYRGCEFDKPDLTLATLRTFFRADICATLILSDLNKFRDEVVAKALTFEEEKPDLIKKLERRKKAEAAAKRKKVKKKKNN